MRDTVCPTCRTEREKYREVWVCKCDEHWVEKDRLAENEAFMLRMGLKERPWRPEKKKRPC